MNSTLTMVFVLVAVMAAAVMSKPSISSESAEKRQYFDALSGMALGKRSSTTADALTSLRDIVNSAHYKSLVSQLQTKAKAKRAMFDRLSNDYLL